MKTQYTPSQLIELQDTLAYSEYIMSHGDRICCNGDMLLELMEDGYLFEEFIQSLSSLAMLASCKEQGVFKSITG